jgi:GNAT superfamily N-acetyltransferase
LKIVGMIDIRHNLGNEFLAQYGGHIGFAVLPSEREKGYATEILKMGIEYAKSLNIEKLMLACFSDNIPSIKTIMKCGGVMTEAKPCLDGLPANIASSEETLVNIYWIDLITPKGEKIDYRNKAINCVKNTILPEQRKQFEECNYCLDEQYKRYGNTEGLFAKTVEVGHVYEIGFPVCVCQDVAKGKANNVSHCECSRQSILYVLENLLPDKNISVEIIETVLGGAEKCRFKVTVD